MSVLAELVPLATQAKAPDSAAWTDELDRLAVNESDECKRANYKAVALAASAATDARLAIQRLTLVPAGCADAFLFAAGPIFEAAMVKSNGVPPDALVSAATHLGEVGDYPYRAVNLIFNKVADNGDKELADRLLLNGIAAYENKPALRWSTNDAFVDLLSAAKRELRKQAMYDGVDLAIRRIAEYKSGDHPPLLRMTMLMKDSTVAQLDARDRTLAKLYGLAQSVDDRLVNRMKEMFPSSRFADFDDSKMVAGIGTTVAGELKPGARFFMDLANLHNQKANASKAELEGMGIRPSVVAAYLALRAGDEARANKAESADQSFAEARKALDSVKDENEKLRVLAVIVESSVGALRYKQAEDAIEEGFGLAPGLLKEELKDSKKTASTSTTISPLRRMARACAAKNELIAPHIRGLRDAKLQSYLYLTLAETLIERRHE